MLRPTKTAFIDSLPILVAYFPLGIVWGILWEQAGLPPLWGIVFSITVYAGTAQFLALAFLITTGSLWGLLAAVIPMGLRNSFYMVAMLDRLPAGRWQRLYSAVAMVDVPFAIMVGHTEEETKDSWYTIPLLVFTHLYWVVGTAIGVWLGIYIPDTFEGLGFSLPALLAVLSIEQQRKVGSWRPFILALLSAISMGIAFGHSWLLPTIIVCSLVTIFWPMKEGK